MHQLHLSVHELQLRDGGNQKFRGKRAVLTVVFDPAAMLLQNGLRAVQAEAVRAGLVENVANSMDGIVL